MTPRPSTKRQRVIYLDHEVNDKLVSYCDRRGVPPSQAVNALVRWHLLIDEPDDRFDKLIHLVEHSAWQNNQASDELKYRMEVLRGMMELFIKQFFFYTPPIDEDRQQEAVASGLGRFERFLDKLAENIHSARKKGDSLEDRCGDDE